MIEFIGPRMPLDIPLAFIIPQEERKKSWEGRKVTLQHSGEADEAWKVRETARRELIAAEIKAKNAAGLARLKAKHEGKKYDRKLKIWVRVAEELPEGEHDQPPVILEDDVNLYPSDALMAKLVLMEKFHTEK
jgi:hypothetical protein